ncbi:hypothetical protein M9H77_13824 [Catharanthus roseus]|uniref:Uncharacterized protein n=1 Tax=Catharanthus roseus TaxID=4058 RepID=A0ACC0BLA2_CATRO|nr:hypothetical protein M9H77_13824 [Catharanthus roseus]
MLGSVTLDLDPVNRGRSTVRGLGPRRGYFLAGCIRRGPPTRVVQGGLSKDFVYVDYGLSSLKPILVPRGTQIPYSAAVDLAEGYGVSQTAGLSTAKITQMRGTREA